jgi:PKD repeat protein
MKIIQRVIAIAFLLVTFFQTMVFGQCITRPSASLRVASNDVCSDEPVRITNETNENNNRIKYIWTWGDGRKDTLFNKTTPSHFYTWASCDSATKSFTVTLDAINLEPGCPGVDHSTATVVYVSKKPAAGFSPSRFEVCTDDGLVRFTNTTCPKTGTGMTYSWNFGDPASGANNTSNAIDPTHNYTIAGNYTVTLTVNGVVCSTPSTTSRTILVRQPAVANATYSGSTCTPASIKFTNASEGATSSTWTVFPSTGVAFSPSPNDPNPTIIFGQTGSYVVTLTITNPCGSKKWTSTPINIIAAPDVKAAPIPSFCVGGSATPRLLSSYEGLTPTTYRWTFEGGSPASYDGKAPSSVTWSTSGIYKVIVDATNTCGSKKDTVYVAVGDLAAINVSKSPNSTTNCTQTTRNYTNNSTGSPTVLWTITPNLGFNYLNGTNRNAKSPTIQFTQKGVYYIKMEMVNACGNNIWLDTITISTPPLVTLAAIPARCEPANATPQTLPTSSEGGLPTTYEWTFQNGTPATFSGKIPPNVVFSSTGLVKVVATNFCGSSTDSTLLVVTPKGQAAATVEGLTPTGCAPFILTLKNTSVGAVTNTWRVLRADGSLAQISDSIVMKNGTTLTSANPQIEFTKAGKFFVELLITNPCGGNLTWKSQEIVVITKPTVQFAAITPTCSKDLTFQVSVNDGGGPLSIKSFSIDTGGVPVVFSTFDNLNFRFNSAGNYTATTTATNACGTVTISQPIRILQTGQAAATVEGLTPTGCAPFILTLKNTSVGAVTNTWRVLRADGSLAQISDSIVMKNGTTLTSANPQIEFTKVGKYFIKLAITNPCGGDLTWKSDTIIVIAKPKVTIDSIQPPCPPFDAAFRVGVDNGGGPLSITRFSIDSNGVIVPFTTFNNLNFRFNSMGNFTVTADVVNVCGEATAQRIVQIKQPAVVAATIENLPTKLCAPFKILMKNTSLGATSNRWTVQSLEGTTGGFQFTDGTTAGSAEPKIEFLKRGRYVIRLEIGNACGANPTWKSDTLTVFESPTVKMDTLQNTDCQPLMVNPKILRSDDGGGGPLSIKWLFVGATTDSSTSLSPSVLFLNAGIVKITIAVTNVCGTTTDEKSITVLGRQNPQITAIKDTICTGDALFMPNLTPSGGIFIVNGGIVANNSPFNPAVLRDSVKLIYRVGVGRCADSTMRTVRVFGTVVNAGRDTVFCDKLTLPFPLLGASPLGSGGTWTDSMGNRFVTPSGVFTPSIAGAGRHNVIYTFRESRAGCLNSATRTVTINERPKAVLEVDSFGCKALITSLNGANSTFSNTYNWNFGDGMSATQATVAHAFLRAGVYNIRLIVGSTANCQDTLTKQITISEPPITNVALANSDGCAGKGFYVKNNGIDPKTTYNWQYGDGRTTNIPQPDSIVYGYNSLRDTTFKITMTAATRGCPAKDTSVFVRLFGRTKADFNTSLDTICAGQIVGLNNFSANAKSVNLNLGNGTTRTDMIFLPQRYVSDSTTKIYTVRLIATGTCNADTFSRFIVVRAAKLKAFVEVGDSIPCFGIPTLLVTRSNDSAVVTHRFDDGTRAMGDTVLHVFSRVGRNVITTFVTNGCEIDSVTRIITVLASPSKAFTFLVPKVCRPDSFLFVKMTNDGSARWDILPSGFRANGLTLGYSFPNSGRFTVKLTSTNPITGCSVSDSVVITPRLPISSPIISITNSPCTQSLGSIFVKFDSLTNGTAPYRFSINNDSIFSNTTGIFTNLSSPKTYVIRVKDANGCVAERTANLTGPTPFSVDAGGTRRINLGDSVLVRAVANRTSLVKYLWQNTEGVSCRTCDVAWLRPFRNTIFTVLATDISGCTDTAKVLVEVNRTGHVFVPNTFSPNRDGVNDVFYPHSDLSVKLIREMNVFDRWGVQVFHRENFAPDVEALGWDGNGGNAPVDVYVWSMTVDYLDGTSEVFKGDINIVK